MADKQVNLSELIKQREELEQQINLIRTTQKTNAINNVQSIIAEHQLTVMDVFPQFGQKVAAKRVGKGEARPVMFRDPVSQKTWTGKGRRPGWLPAEGDVALEQFRVAQ